MHKICPVNLQESRAMAEREPRDAAANFDTWRVEFYNIVRAVFLPPHGLFVGLCLQTTVNHL